MDPLQVLPQSLTLLILRSLDIKTLINCEQVFIYKFTLKLIVY